MSWPLIRYVLTAALRDRLIISLIIALVVSISLAIFMGSAAISEKGSFALVFAGAGIRLAGVLGLVLFSVFFIRRSFEARDVEYLLSRPISRVEFILSYSAGLSLIALGLGLVEGLCLYLPEPKDFGQGHLFWVISITLENIIMVNVGLFFSMILSSAATGAMACAGFYVLTRMMGQLLGMIDGHVGTGALMQGLDNLMQVISMVLPRLDLMGQTSWLVYDLGGDMNFGIIMTQGLVFAVLAVLASLIDLARRQF